jgi:hypothetical protein
MFSALRRTGHSEIVQKGTEHRRQVGPRPMGLLWSGATEDPTLERAILTPPTYARSNAPLTLPAIIIAELTPDVFGPKVPKIRSSSTFPELTPLRLSKRICDPVPAGVEPLALELPPHHLGPKAPSWCSRTPLK